MVEIAEKYCLTLEITDFLHLSRTRTPTSISDILLPQTRRKLNKFSKKKPSPKVKSSRKNSGISISMTGL